MSETFITSSLPFAAYLVASDSLHLREIRLTDPRRAVFVLEDNEGRGPQLEASFLNGSAVVSALAFHQQLRTLRRSIDEKVFAARSGVNEQHPSQGKKENGNYKQLSR
jgi:hypothetical protein